MAKESHSGLCDLQEKNGLDVGSNCGNEMKYKEDVSSIAAIEQEKYFMQRKSGMSGFCVCLAGRAPQTRVSQSS